MKKFIMIGLIGSMLVTSVYAYNERGLKTYKKVCKKCHGSPFKGAAMKTSDEWRDLFDANGEHILALHKDLPKVFKKLHSSYYKNRKASLVDFLVNSSKDSGVVVGCDANHCGG